MIIITGLGEAYELWNSSLCISHPVFSYFFIIRVIATNILNLNPFQYCVSTIWDTEVYGNTVLTKNLTAILTRQVYVYNWSPQVLLMKHTLDSVSVYRHLVIITTVWGNHVTGLISWEGRRDMIPTQTVFFALIDDLNLEQQHMASDVQIQQYFCLLVPVFKMCLISVLFILPQGRTHWYSGEVLSSLFGLHRHRISASEWLACLHIWDVRVSNLGPGQAESGGFSWFPSHSGIFWCTAACLKKDVTDYKFLHLCD